MSDAYSVHRVRTSFAILTGDENLREELLDAAPKLSDFSAKFEEASKFVAFRIAKVPVTMLEMETQCVVDVWALHFV